MTYNEWRDELKSNLLCVSESERRRVLDYYAEAYADRRDAGFTEREIIEDFGAPYDAAQRILGDSFQSYGSDEYYDEPKSERRRRHDDEKRRRADERQRRRDAERRRERYDDDYDYYQSPPPSRETEKKKNGGDYTWVFVILCIIFCVPLFSLIMTMVGISIGFCVAPFAVLIAGIATIGAGIGAMFVNVLDGLCTLATGLIIFGVGIMLMAVFPRFVKFMWSVFKKFFGWLKSLFSGKECA